MYKKHIAISFKKVHLLKDHPLYIKILRKRKYRGQS